jgi:DNA-binding MurR/RpiR family transcriptional regulator
VTARKLKRPRSGNGGPVDLKSLIRARYAILPANQRKIAEYLLRNLREAPFLSIVELERRSGASRATIVRFARNIGFSGFLELRSRLMEGVQLEMVISEHVPLLESVGKRDTLALVAQQDVRNVDQTISHLDKQTFQRVVAMFLRASRVYTAGLGISSLMAEILAYLLNQVAVRASPFVHDYETFLDQAPFLSPHDVLVVFSFPPYSRETVDLAKAAQHHSIPVIAITDRLTSPISFYSVEVLAIRSQNMLFTNSFSAISVVINALATEVAFRNKRKALRMMRQVDRLLRETGHFVSE